MRERGANLPKEDKNLSHPHTLHVRGGKNVLHLFQTFTFSQNLYLLKKSIRFKKINYIYKNVTKEKNNSNNVNKGKK